MGTGGRKLEIFGTFVVEYLKKIRAFSHVDVRKIVATRNSETNGIKVQLQLGS